jgi:hypothetical protein
MRSTLTLLALGLFGCQTAPAVKKEVNKEVKTDAATVPLLSLERSPCFGACPVYTVEVLSNGVTTFKGVRHVKVTEPVELKLEPATLEKLNARFEASEFAKWGDFTRTPVSDMPTVVLTYRGHTVRHYLGDDKAPAALTALEDEVDAIIGTERWVKGTGAVTQ